MIRYVLLPLHVVVILYYTFYHPYSFNYEIDTHHYFLLGPFLYGLMILGFMIVSDKIGDRRICLPVMAALLLVFGCLAFTDLFSIANEYFFNLVFLLLFFFLSVNLLDRNAIHFFIAVFLLVFVAGIVSGLYQIVATDLYILNKPVLVTGPLQNSSIFGCWLVVQAPLLYYYLLEKESGDRKVPLWIRRLVVLVLLTAVLVILLYTQARSALLAFGVMVIAKYWSRKRAILFLLAASLLCCGLLFLKRDSTTGRLLIWKIILQHGGDHFWGGLGIGRFTWYYPQWQAAWFKTADNGYDASYFGAGETYIAFNEYLQWFKETGIAGIILAGIVLYRVFRLKATTGQEALLYSLKGSVAGILICGISSYPLHSTPILFLLFFCVAAGTIVAGTRPLPDRRAIRLVKRTMAYGLLVAAGFMVFMASGYIRAAAAWGRLPGAAASWQQQYAVYREAYGTLRKDGKFLAAYGQFLASDSSKGREAVRVLEEGSRYFISVASVNVRARAYAGIGDYTAAIEQYKWLEDYLPNRFRPRFELLNLYGTIHDTTDRVRTAQEIMSMPIKVPSGEVEEIRDAARLIISNNY